MTFSIGTPPFMGINYPPGAVRANWADHIAAGYEGGIDFGADFGTHLHSLGQGIVTEVISPTSPTKNSSLTATFTDFKNRDTRWVLMHMSDIAVKKGDVLDLDTYLGKSGGKLGTNGAGQSTGAHVHLHVLINGVKSDPDAYMRALAKYMNGG